MRSLIANDRWIPAAVRGGPRASPGLAPPLDTTLRAALSPAGIIFSTHALSAISTAIAEHAWTDIGTWPFTPDQLDLDGLSADAAWGLAADVVTITMDRQFVDPEPSPVEPR